MVQSQVLAPPTHFRLVGSQASPLVHGLPSLQLRLLPTCVQPVLLSQASVVHGLASSHGAALPP